MGDENTTITIKKSTWKRLAQAKLDGEYDSFDEMLLDWLNSEHPTLQETEQE